MFLLVTLWHRANLLDFVRAYPIITTLVVIYILCVIAALLVEATKSSNSSFRGAGGGGYPDGSYTSSFDNTRTSAQIRMRVRSNQYLRDVNDTIRR